MPPGEDTAFNSFSYPQLLVVSWSVGDCTIRWSAFSPCADRHRRQPGVVAPSPSRILNNSAKPAKSPPNPYSDNSAKSTITIQPVTIRPVTTSDKEGRAPEQFRFTNCFLYASRSINDRGLGQLKSPIDLCGNQGVGHLPSVGVKHS